MRQQEELTKVAELRLKLEQERFHQVCVCVCVERCVCVDNPLITKSFARTPYLPYFSRFCSTK